VDRLLPERAVRNRPSVGAITTFGLGRLRPAPGTWGSLPPVVLAAAMLAAGFPPLLATAVLLVVLVYFSAACLVQGDAAEARFGGKDPSSVVADETAGQCLPLLLLPAVAHASPLAGALTLLAAFLLFRVFDILKPWPADRLQAVPGGWGILLDDLIAGLYALATLHAAAWAITFL